MAWRKRASPAPWFRQPAPYNPITGKYAPIGREGILSRVAMMQIVGDDETVTNQDTHANYVICRGFDPETEKFYNSLKVGKPYGIRGSYPYQLAEVYPAIKPRTRIGDTPGMGETTTGHPADLDEEIEVLKDEDGNPIAWLLLDGGGMTLRWGKLDEDMTPGTEKTVSLWQGTGGDWGEWNQDSGEDWEVYAPPLFSSGTITSGKWLLVGIINGRKVALLHEC